jgi:hypothetical protein
MIGIYLQRLFVVMKGEGHFVLCLTDQCELTVAGKPMTGQVIFLAVDTVGVAIDATHQREQDRGVTRPFRTSLPHILTPLVVSHTLELGTLLCDFDRQQTVT